MNGGQRDFDSVMVKVRPSTREGSPESGGVAVMDPLAAGSPGTSVWWDTAYRTAGGEASRLDWAQGKADPALVTWLNAEASGRVRPGSRAVVVGCGLGDDVAELLSRGYDAIGFDVSPAAIEWARKRFPQHAEAFCVADVFGLPTRYRHRFELIVEACTLQAVHPTMREVAAGAIASMCGPRGVVVAIADAREEHELAEDAQGPPWPLTGGELAGLMEAGGLKPTRTVDDFHDDRTPARRRVRGAFERA